MNPINAINAAIAALDAILNIINEIKGQGGMTDDQILAASQAQTVVNQAQIQQLLASLPPTS